MLERLVPNERAKTKAKAAPGAAGAAAKKKGFGSKVGLNRTAEQLLSKTREHVAERTVIPALVSSA